MMYNQNVLTYCKTIYMISWSAFYNLIEFFPSFKLISPILSESCPHANRLLNFETKATQSCSLALDFVSWLFVPV